MARNSKYKDKAWELFRDSGGKLSAAEIVEKLNHRVPANTVRTWRRRYKWDESLGLPKQHEGFQVGNKCQPETHKGVDRNCHAMVSMAYASPRWELLSDEQKSIVDTMVGDIVESDGYSVKQMKFQLRNLYVRQMNLENELAKYSNDPGDSETYLDRVSRMMNPEGEESTYRYESSADARRTILERSLSSVSKQIESILKALRESEAVAESNQLRREEFEFRKSRTAGVFTVDEDGNIVADDDSVEVIEE